MKDLVRKLIWGDSRGKGGDFWESVLPLFFPQMGAVGSVMALLGGRGVGYYS